LATDDPVSQELATRQRGLRPTAVASIVACAALLVASLGAGALVNWVQRESGAGPVAVKERAWFQDATSISHGVTVLAPIQFVIVPTSDSPISWVAYNNGKTYQRGIAQGKTGTDVVVTLPTWTMKPGSWLTIGITGLHQSLKAWVT